MILCQLIQTPQDRRDGILCSPFNSKSGHTKSKMRRTHTPQYHKTQESFQLKCILGQLEDFNCSQDTRSTPGFVSKEICTNQMPWWVFPATWLLMRELNGLVNQKAAGFMSSFNRLELALTQMARLFCKRIENFSVKFCDDTKWEIFAEQWHRILKCE